jgi:cytochrome c biogenesis protein CcdA
MSNKNLIWFILGTILLVVLYSITFGKIDLTNQDKLSEEEKRQKAVEEHKRLKKEIGVKDGVIKKVKNRRKTIYFFARLIIVIGWLLVNGLLYFSNIGIALNDLVTYNEIFIIIIIVLIYLFGGNFSNLKEIADYFKNIVENRLFKKRLELAKKQKTALENKKEEIESTINQ